jgi:hypothetical protein
MIYEFITPSDPITFKAESDKIAFYCALLLGSGRAGLGKENGKPEMSPMLFLNPDPVKDIEEYIGVSIADFGDKNAAEIAEAFNSFAYGSISERSKYDAEIAAITDTEQLQLFRDKIEDQSRTSMSQWVKSAWQYSKHFKAVAAQEQHE